MLKNSNLCLPLLLQRRRLRWLARDTIGSHGVRTTSSLPPTHQLPCSCMLGSKVGVYHSHSHSHSRPLSPPSTASTAHSLHAHTTDRQKSVNRISFIRPPAPPHLPARSIPPIAAQFKFPTHLPVDLASISKNYFPHTIVPLPPSTDFDLELDASSSSLPSLALSAPSDAFMMS